jgi:hypothetical protein
MWCFWVHVYVSPFFCLFYCFGTCVDGGLCSFLLFIGVIIRHFSKVVLCYEFMNFLIIFILLYY